MIKLPEDRYIEREGWVGIDHRFWLKIIKVKRFFKKTIFKIELISNRDEFETEEKAIEFAKHILWCWHELIKRQE